MNTPRPPLTPDDVDTLLSAELDGGFESAATDLGLSAVDARDRLDATPGVQDRRHAMTRARDLIATSPPLSSTLEDRLIATAMAPDDLATKREERGGRDRARTSRRILIAAGSVAAAVAVVVGVSNMRNPDAAKSSAGAKHALSSASDAPPLGGNLIDFGDVTNGSDLQTRVRRAVEKSVDLGDSAAPEANATSAPQSDAASGGTGAQSTSADKAHATPTPTPAPATFGVQARSCTEAVRQRYAIASEPPIVGTGRVSGAPVVVLVFERGNGADVAYIVRPQTCALVRKQPLG